MLASMALHQIKASAPLAVKRVLWSAVVGKWYSTAITRIYGGDQGAYISDFVSSNRDGLIVRGYDAGVQMNEPSNDFDFLVLPVVSGVTGSSQTQISVEVAQKLLDPQDSFSLLHHNGIARFISVLRHFDFDLPPAPLEAHHEEVQRFVEVWTAQLNSLEPRYIQDKELLVKHLRQVLLWLAELIDGRGDVGRVARLRLQQRITDELYGANLIPSADWSLVVPAQLGSNAAAGLAFWLGDRGVPVENRQLTRLDQVAGMTLENQCKASRETDAGLTSSDHGGSLADNTLNAEQLWHEPLYFVAPEASCVLVRAQTADPALPPSNFQSKFNATQMAWLLERFTSGPAMQGVPTPVDTTLQVNGSEAISKLYFGIKDIWYDFKDRTLANAIQLAANTSGHGLTAILQEFAVQERTMVQNNPDTAQYIAAQIRKEELSRAYLEATGHSSSDPHGLGAGARLNGLACRRHLEVHWGLDLGSMDFTCEQLYDIVFWLDHLALEFMLRPQFIFDEPDSVVPSLSHLSSGPIIRAKGVDYLDGGLDDPLFRRIFGFKYPGAAPWNSDQANTWLAQYADDMEPDAVDIGVVSQGDIGLLVKRNGSRSLEIWGGVTLISGSASGWQIPPQLQRVADFGEYAPSVSVWMPSLERPARFTYTATKQDNDRGLRVHRYELLESADIQSLPSDVAFCRRAEVQACRGPEVESAPPSCLRSLRFAPSLFDTEKSYEAFLIGQPFLFGCDADTQALGYEWVETVQVDRSSSAAHGSFAEYEPIVGQSVRSRFQEGKYVEIKPSRWFQHAPHAVLQLHSLSRERNLPVSMVAAWAADVGTRNQLIDSSIPGGCFGGGTILAVVGLLLLCLFRRRRALVRARVRPPKVRSYAEVQALRAQRMKEAEEALKKQDEQKRLTKAGKRAVMLRKDPAATAKTYTLEEIEQEMQRLAERKQALEEAAAAGKAWAKGVQVAAQRPGTAPADAEIASKRAAQPSLAAVTQEQLAAAEVGLEKEQVEAAVRPGGGVLTRLSGILGRGGAGDPEADQKAAP